MHAWEQQLGLVPVVALNHGIVRVCYVFFWSGIDYACVV